MVEDLFDAVSRRLLEEDPDLEQGRMFTATGLKTAGKFFAMTSRGELVVKLPAERVDELVAAGRGHPFEAGRRVMKEWVSLRPDDEATCAAYVTEARSFVAALAQS